MKKKVITLSFITLLAIGLWLSVVLSQDYITTVSSTISFCDIPKKYSVGYASNNEIYLQLKGRGWDLIKFLIGTQDEFQVSVRKRVGKNKVDLANALPINPWLTSHFEVLEISPNQIEYEVERIISKKVKIVSNISLDFKPDFAATSIVSIYPEYVEISGTQSILKDIDSIKTEAKYFKNISENFSTRLDLEEIPGVTCATKNCTLQFEVQKIVDKSFDAIPILVKNVPTSKDLVLYPGKTNIILRGGINNLGKLTADSIKIFVDYWSALKENSGTIEPVIIIPAYTKLVSSEPQKIEFIIKQN